MTNFFKILGVLLLAGALFFVGKSWLEAHDLGIQLKEQLKAQQAIVDAAEKRIKDRDQEVLVYKGTIETLKRRTITPQQVVATLPQVVQLPKPIYQTPDLPNAPSQVVVPTESVKPLFDRLADCNVSEISLKSCEQTRKDLMAEVAAERKAKEDAIKAFKGGSFITRVKRNGKWMISGGLVAIGVEQAVKHR